METFQILFCFITNVLKGHFASSFLAKIFVHFWFHGPKLSIHVIISGSPVARFSMKCFPVTAFKIAVVKGYLVWVGVVFGDRNENLCAE